MKNIQELIEAITKNKVIMNSDRSMIFEGHELVSEILKGLADKEEFTITLLEEDLPSVGWQVIADSGWRDLRVDSITLDMVEKQGKKISNSHAREQGRKSEVYLKAEELNVFDYIKGAELTLRRRGPAGGALMDAMTDLDKLKLQYRYLFCMQWFRVNNSEAFHVLLD
jgi:hypothetical protein